MKTKHNNWRNFRKLKCSSKSHKIQTVSQNATKILNNQCSFVFRHQLYRSIYHQLGVYWVYFICYMCTLRLIELKLFGKILNQYHAKCMRLSKMRLVPHCYTGVLYESISKLYMYSAVYLSDCRVCFFRKIQELRNRLSGDTCHICYIMFLISGLKRRFWVLINK